MQQTSIVRNRCLQGGRDALTQNIVQINAQNTSKTETPLVNKIIAPLNEGEVFLASEEDNIKKQSIEEFNDVFKTQSQMKE